MAGRGLSQSVVGKRNRILQTDLFFVRNGHKMNLQKLQRTVKEETLLDTDGYVAV